MDPNRFNLPARDSTASKSGFSSARLLRRKKPTPSTRSRPNWSTNDHDFNPFGKAPETSTGPVPGPGQFGLNSDTFGTGVSGKSGGAVKGFNLEDFIDKNVVSDELGKLSIGNNREKQSKKKLSLVNGVLFTGGWAKTGLYFDVVEAIFKKALEKNDAGDYFPVLATCLGFELLTMIISKDQNILEEFSAADQATTLQFMENISIQGTLFQRFPPELLKKLSTDCLVMQNHHYGISPQNLAKNADLCSFFEVLTISTDEDDQVYVSTVQAKKYPVIGFQWHPEKNAFEWGSSKIPHTEDAIQVMQHIANYFVGEARKSLNKPPAAKVLDNLIYNYSPTYCGKAGRGYDEVYLFTKP